MTSLQMTSYHSGAAVRQGPSSQAAPRLFNNAHSAHKLLQCKKSSMFGRVAAFKPARAGATRQALSARLVSAALGSEGTVAITGGTGFIGSKLVSQLLTLGYKVRVLTRNVGSARAKLPYAGVEYVGPAQWAAAIRGCTAVLNLAGEPIATRWTPEHKREIKRSRVDTTNKLVDAINACPEAERPKVLVSTSAVGFYGISESQTFSETSNSGNDYLAEVCREWEAAAERAKTRVVIIRTGIVLGKEGGAIGRMLPVFEIFAGGPLGSGRQWCSWIHRDDVVGMYVEALRNESWRGVYNATAPNPVRMGEMCSALGQVMSRPSWIPVPDFALTALLGEGASVVLEGQRVLPVRAQDGGYKFKYDKINDALRAVLR